MRIAVIGGGASGMMCASICSENSENEVLLLEKNEKLGKKIYITGKGRCNFTNNCDSTTFFQNVVTNPKFLYSAINSFSPRDMIAFMEKNGLKSVTERGNRVFPLSQKASDVTKTFEKVLARNSVKIHLNTDAKSIKKENDNFKILTNKGAFEVDSVVVATGGASYSQTGSSGKGYEIAKSFGHNVVKPRPSLVAIDIKNFNKNLAGLTLKNVTASINVSGKTFAEFGEMLFTHNGVSGPIILTLSAKVNKFDLKGATLFLDLKPALSMQKLDEKFVKEFAENHLKSFKTYLKTLLPSGFIDEFCTRLSFSSSKKLCDITKKEREEISYLLKIFSYDKISLGSLESAIVTSGGVDTREVSPKNMMSKLCKNLFFTGEVLDLDALTGGFNLQIAFSTGFCAGNYLKNCNE